MTTTVTITILMMMMVVMMMMMTMIMMMIIMILRAPASVCPRLWMSYAKMLKDDGSKENNNSSLQLCNYK